MLILLYQYFFNNDIRNKVFDHFKAIHSWTFLKESFELRAQLVTFLRNIDDKGLISFIRNNGGAMFSELIINITNIFEVVQAVKFGSDLFKFEWDSIINEDPEKCEVSNHLNELLDRQIEDDIDELLEMVHAQDFVDEKEIAVEEATKYLKEVGFNVKANLSNYGQYNWWEVGLNNYVQQQMSRAD